MEIKVQAFLVHGFEDIESFPIFVNDKNYILVRMKLEEQYDRIVKLLKRLFSAGEIKSIYIPKNKKIQKQLNNLVTTKKSIKKSLDQIKISFYK